MSLDGIVTRATLLLLLAPSAGLAQGAGDLDPGFSAGGKAQVDFNHSTDIANDVAIQPDGKIVAVGQTYTNNDYSQEDFAVLRLLPDGTPDPAFGSNGRVTTDFPGLAAVASAVVVQPDGRIVVAGGAFPLFTFIGDFVVVRYLPNGDLDPGFGVGGIVTTSFPGQGSYAFDVALQPDGKLIAAGTDYVNFSSSQSSDTDFALARYDSSGNLDPGFGSGGRVTTDFDGFNDDAFKVLVQPDGKLVAVGSALATASFYDFAAARYLPDGTLDPTFGAGGRTRQDFGNLDFDRAHGAALQPDGGIVAAGFTIYDLGLSQPFALLRWDANGVLDTSFAGDGLQEVDFGSFLQAAWDVVLQPDGKILTAGYPNSESSDSDFLLARLNGDGTLDTSFSGDGKVRTSFGDLNGGAYGVALQPDGRIVTAGFQANFNALGVEFAIARHFGDAPTWVDKRGALPGTLGDPVLTATGTLAAGSSGTILLTNAAPAALAALFLATSGSPVPFKGGMLQPFPFLGPFFTTTSPGGSIPVPYTTPAGIPGATEVWLQWAIADPGAVQGVALSNAIMAVAP